MELQLLSAIDYAVFAAMLVISAGIGIFFRFSGGKQKTVEEYLMGGKDLNVFPVALSLMATFVSSISVMGLPADFYYFGIAIAYTNIGNIIGMILSAYMCLPVFFELKTASIYEYLERRFGKTSRIVCTSAFLISTIPCASVVLYAPALVLSTVTYLSTWTSVVTIGTVCTFYCSIGGIKAVVWTDVFQGMLMFFGILVVLVKGFLDMGFTEIFSVALKNGRLDTPGFEFDPTIRYTMWGLVCQGFILAMYCYSASQVQVQRLLTVKNITRSRRALYISMLMIMGFSLINLLVGIVVYAYFADCDPFTSPDHPISQADQLLPYYMMRALGAFPGLPGLCICGMFSSALSTVSSAINSLTAVTMADAVRPALVARGVSDVQIVFVSKVITMVYGMACIVMAFFASYAGNLVQAALTFTGLMGGPILGVFLLGMLTTRANEKGVGIGLVVSTIISSWITFGASVYGPPPKVLPVSVQECPFLNESSNIAEGIGIIMTSSPFISNASLTVINSTAENEMHSDNEDIFYLYRLSYMWFSPIGFAICMVVGYISSILINFITENKEDVSNELLSPFAKSITSNTDDTAGLKLEKPEDKKPEKISYVNNGFTT